MITITIAGPDDWEQWRTLRLGALQDSPLAFGSSYEREAGRTEEEWRGWLSRTDGQRYIAHDGDHAAGIAAVYIRVDGAGDDKVLVPELVSMWVHPDWRGKGVGRLLVDEVGAWVAERGYDEFRIMVTTENEAALRFYERLGFAETGFVQPVPHDDARLEHEMSRPVAP